MRPLAFLLALLVALPAAAQGTLQTVVTDLGGIPATGIDVDFYAVGSDELAFSGTTDSAGIVTIPDVPAGTYTAYVEPDTGFITIGEFESASPDGTPGALFVQQVDPSQVLLTGTIRDADTAAPLERVIALFLFEGPVAGISLSYTSTLGRYAVQVPAGGVEVEALFVSYRDEDDQPRYFEEVEPFTVTADAGETEVRDLALRVLPTGSISGTVVDEATGEPIEGADLSFSSANSAFSFAATTDQDGRYATDLPQGEYIVQTFQLGYANEYYDSTYRLADATPVQIVSGETTSGISFSLVETPDDPPLTTIQGEIRDAETGELVPGAEVRVYYPDITPFGFVSATTTPDGVYSLDVDPALASYYDFTIGAVADGYETTFHVDASDVFEARLLTASPLGGETLTGIDVRLAVAEDAPEGFAVSGTVQAEAGGAIENAFVIATDVQSGAAFLGVSDATGAYEIDGLAEGEYVVLFTASGFAPEYFNGQTDWTTADVISLSGDATGIDALMGGLNRPVAGRGPAEVSVRGRVLAADGTPVSRALVTARLADGSIADFALTDASGAYTLRGLNGTASMVRASAVRYEVEEASVNVGGGFVQTGSLLTFSLTSARVASSTAGGPEARSPLTLFPNPTRGTVRARFALAEASVARVAVYDALGREVAVVAERGLAAGEHTVPVGVDLAPGLYVLRVETGTGAQTGRFMVVR